MVRIPPEENELMENGQDDSYLLHELQNVVLEESEDEIEAEQRDRMPAAAFLRDNVEDEAEIDENIPSTIGPSNLVHIQPEKIRRTLNDNRLIFGPNGKYYFQSSKWTDQPLGDTVFDLYKGIFDCFVKWTNVRIRQTIETMEVQGKTIEKYMTEVDEDDIKKYFGTLLTQSLFKGDHMRMKEWIDKLPKTMAAWDRPNCHWIRRYRFSWIRNHLDCGDNIKVPRTDKKGNIIYSSVRDPLTNELRPRQILCLKTKLEEMYLIFNTVSLAQKEPDDNMVALDESIRPSYSSKDPRKVYMPSKPVKVRIFHHLQALL